MTIRQAQQDLRVARSAFASHDILTGARLALSAQSLAAQSRSRLAYDIEFTAHGLAALAIDRYPDASQPIRSELGRIASESKYLFQRGDTASRA